MLEADDRFAAEGVAKLVHGILKLGVIDYNIQRGTMRRNRHMYEMFDVPWELRDSVESPEDFILRIHPADAGIFLKKPSLFKPKWVQRVAHSSSCEAHL
jgi:hypothetical protein